ncbi:MAG: nucleotidyltransferase domain-containing protein [Fluviicola sp.]|jgi:predicted nucleotidyltransferase|nr:nucleotidyltransferase domain-containing protein [Fluviicola sp.]
MFGLSENEIEIIRSIFSKYSQVSRVEIFGSRVKNTFNERSDIDLVIKNEIDETIISQILNDFDESDLIYKVDLKSIASIKNVDLLDHIERLGKVVYESE